MFTEAMAKTISRTTAAKPDIRIFAVAKSVSPLRDFFLLSNPIFLELESSEGYCCNRGADGH